MTYTWADPGFLNGVAKGKLQADHLDQSLHI